MIGKNVVSTRVATLSEVSDILEARKASGEVGFEQQACLDYSTRFKKIDKKKAAKFVESLLKNEKIKESTAVKIADVMPKYESQLVAILQKDRCDLTKAEMGDVLKQIEELAPARPEPKEPLKEAKEPKETKEPKDAKESKDSKETKEAKEPKEAKESKEQAKEEKQKETKGSKE